MVPAKLYERQLKYMLNPEGTYTKTMAVELFEVDRWDRMKLSWLMRRQQQGGEEQLQQMGIGYETLIGQGMVFLLSKVVLEVKRLPKTGDLVQIHTCPLPCKGAQFFRETSMTTPQGEELVHFHTAWMLVNPQDHKILRPTAFPYTLTFGQPDYDPAIFKFKAAQGEEAGVRPVYYSDLDINHHVNNAVYGDMCLDFLPPQALEGHEVAAFAIHYISEARPGDKLQIMLAQPQADTYTVAGLVEGRPSFEAVVTLRPAP